MKRSLLALCGALWLWALLLASSFAAPAPPPHEAATAKAAKAGKVFYHSPGYLRTHQADIGKAGTGNLIYYDGPVGRTLAAR